MPLLLISVTFALLGGCANLGGTAGVDGTGDNPERKTRTIALACTDNELGTSTVLWELAVETSPIVGGELFGADFRAVAVFYEL